MHKTDVGFDFDGALEALIEKYGQEEVVVKATPVKKRKGDTEDSADGSASKKQKKTETFANESNKLPAEAIKEMADLYFKNKDGRKGGDISELTLHIFACV